jgi:ribbon-helix-helix CopG family protein
MQTTIELPDDLYQALEVRAEKKGVTLHQIVRSLLEQGLDSPKQPTGTRERPVPPPVIIPPRGVPIPAVPREQLIRMDEEDDQAKHARPA